MAVDVEAGNYPVSTDATCSDVAQTLTLQGNTNEVCVRMPAVTANNNLVAIVSFAKAAVAAGTNCIRMTPGTSVTVNMAGVPIASKYVGFINGGTASETPLLEVLESKRV